MSDQQRPAPAGTEQAVHPTHIDTAGAADTAGAVDDHVVTPYPRGIGHQPTGALDRGVETEHLASASQGVKVERVPDPDRPAPPPGDSER